MEQERHVVTGDVHVTLVDLGGPGHGVEVFDLWAIRIVLNDSVGVFVGDAEDFVQGLAVGVLNDGEVELAAADEVEDFALVEGAVGVCGDWRSDESDLDGGVRALDGSGEAVVTGPAYGRGEEDEEVEVFGDLDGFIRGDVVGRGIEELRSFEHASGIGEPDGVPVGLDLAGGWPTGAGATVKIFKGGRIEKQRLKRHGQLLILPFRYWVKFVFWGSGCGSCKWVFPEPIDSLQKR